MRAAAVVLLGALAGLAQAVPARAQGLGEPAPAPECCLSLLLPLGGRALALGNALSARTSPDAVYLNPAGLAGLRGSQFAVQRASSFAGDLTGLSVFFVAPAVGTLGLSYRLLDQGTQEIRDENDMLLGEFTVREHALLASFATELVAGLSAGVNYKLYHLAPGCSGGICGQEDGSGTTHGIDLGVRFAPRRLPALRVGASVLNLGFRLQVINQQQADRFPTRLRVGAAYDLLAHVPVDSALALWASVEVARTLGADPPRTLPAFGLELSFRDAAFVRAGHVSGTGDEGWTALGIGLKYDRFSVAVAMPFGQGVLDSGEDPFHITFGVAF